jgi:hypothetical protein
MKKLNFQLIQRERKLSTDIWKREKENSVPAAKAGAKCWVQVPSSPPRHGDRQGWWGHVRWLGAARHWPHAQSQKHHKLVKPLGTIYKQLTIKNAPHLSQHPHALHGKDRFRFEEHRNLVRRYATSRYWESTKSQTERVIPKVGKDRVCIFIVW